MIVTSGREHQRREHEVEQDVPPGEATAREAVGDQARRDDGAERAEHGDRRRVPVEGAERHEVPCPREVLPLERLGEGARREDEQLLDRLERRRDRPEERQCERERQQRDEEVQD
jgi:hypothetical protein